MQQPMFILGQYDGIMGMVNSNKKYCHENGEGNK